MTMVYIEGFYCLRGMQYLASEKGELNLEETRKALQGEVEDFNNHIYEKWYRLMA